MHGPPGLHDRAAAGRLSRQQAHPNTRRPIEDYRARCLAIKEQRADLVKHHLWVLWTDYFKPEHLEKHPTLHELFWKATKEAGVAKKSQDPEQGRKLLELIEEIDSIFRALEREKRAA